MTTENKTITRNQFVGCVGCLIESYGSKTKVCDLPKSELDDSASYLSRALKFFGDGDSARTQANNSNWWNLSVKELCAELEMRFDEIQLDKDCGL